MPCNSFNVNAYNANNDKVLIIVGVLLSSPGRLAVTPAVSTLGAAVTASSQV